MKKKQLLHKKPYDSERKHTKTRYSSQNLFCKTYILEHLIAKTSSTKIYFAMNFFFKVTHVLFLYTVYIYIYIQLYIIYIIYIYIYTYIFYIYTTYIYIYIYIYVIYIYNKENTITIPGADGFDAMDERI